MTSTQLLSDICHVFWHSYALRQFFHLFEAAHDTACLYICCQVYAALTQSKLHYGLSEATRAGLCVSTGNLDSAF